MFYVLFLKGEGGGAKYFIFYNTLSEIVKNKVIWSLYECSGSFLLKNLFCFHLIQAAQQHQQQQTTVTSSIPAVSNVSSSTSVPLESIAQQKRVLQEQIQQSEQNLAAQHAVLFFVTLPLDWCFLCLRST